MHNPEFVLLNELHKLLWDFEIQMDNLISARQPDLMIVNKTKRTGGIVDFNVLADYRVKLSANEKCRGRYKLHKINHLIYMEDIKFSTKKEKELETRI